MFRGGQGEREQGENTAQPGELTPEEQVTSLKSLGLAKMRCDQRGSRGSKQPCTAPCPSRASPRLSLNALRSAAPHAAPAAPPDEAESPLSPGVPQGPEGFLKIGVIPRIPHAKPPAPYLWVRSVLVVCRCGEGAPTPDLRRGLSDFVPRCR